VSPLASKRALLALVGLTLGLLTAVATPAAAAPLGLDRLDYTPADCNSAPLTPHTARCFALVTDKPATKLKANAAAPVPAALSPADIQAAYHLPAAGAGQTVAIVDALGNSAVEADLAVFRAQYGLPPCTSDNGCFRKVDQDGGTDYPADDKGWGLETSLDVDAVSAVCPACRILLVQAASTSLDDLGTGVETAVRLGAKYVSNSYGTQREFADEAGGDHYYDHPGVVITASSGDAGNVPIWPSTSPDVLAVGGTTLNHADGTARGWAETAWSGGGSGCSAYEPKPPFQAGVATGCDRRAVADISAVADPDTGLSVYDSLEYDGWQRVGGTSLSSPLVAAMYALAGPPVAGTYPVTYPYIGQGNGLFDVTAGTDGTCGTVLCTAGPGWDAPTGFGTPDGVSALTLGAHGTLGGHLTSGGSPIAGATVTLTDPGAGKTFRATTDDKGAYGLTIAAGTYTLTATAYGYDPAVKSGVAVADGAAVTADLTMVKVPTRHVTGKVTDGSGHRYPLAATVTVDGYPGGAIHTDPYTGSYAVDLPEHGTYAVHATPVFPGYQRIDTSLTVGSASVRKDFAVAADLTGCAAPGYSYPLASSFETGAEGWTVTDHAHTGLSWQFDDQQLNLTGGSGNYAAADPFDNGGTAVDADLTSPAADLTRQPAALHFGALVIGSGVTARADLSVDNGSTWSAVWSHDDGTDFLGPVDLAIPQAASRKAVRVRFHFAGSGAALMEVDDVRFGQCGPVVGGLVEGTVTDQNTDRAIGTATVTDRSTAGKPGAGTDADGFYWTFSSPAGKHGYEVTAPRYAPSTVTARTVANAVVRRDVVLRAGQLIVSPGSVGATARAGSSVSRKVTLKNIGRSAMHVSFVEQGGSTGSSTPTSGAPAVTVPGAVPDAPRGAGDSAPVARPALVGSAWTNLASLPAPVQDNAAGYDRGKTYSVGGIDAFIGGTVTAHGYVYDPAAGRWAPIADLPQPVDAPGAAFLNGTMYVVGGWTSTLAELSTVYAYHPDRNTWTRVADLPAAVATPAVATLGGKLYVVGGCTQECVASTAAVYRYDPAANRWTRLADYPQVIHWLGCAGASGQIVCAGGVNEDDGGHATYQGGTNLYDPATKKWTHGADLPEPAFGMSYAGANGMLQIIGGAVDGGTTNRVQQYDPVADVWSDLPAANLPFTRGAGGCGLTRVGGWPDIFQPPTSTAETLPGFNGCEGDDVSWLSVDRTSLDLAPGRSATVTVRLTAAAPAGALTATLFANTDTPYDSQPIPVALRVTAGR
jgi:N-acetylneuraminic acid mutarotase